MPKSVTSSKPSNSLEGEIVVIIFYVPFKGLYNIE